MIAEQLNLFNNKFKNKIDRIDTSGKIYVNGYYRGNGTYVKPHWRKQPSRQIDTRKNLLVCKEHLPLFSS